LIKLRFLGLAALGASVLTSASPSFAQPYTVVQPGYYQPVDLYVGVAPPPLRPEFRPAPPGPPRFWYWQSGHWRWNGARYYWQPGVWVHRPHPRAFWVAPHWVHRPGGWFFVEGHWR
jgi:hypothetical protein